MPYTLAHPLYAFPIKYLNRKVFSMTGLVLGSMGPDIEYFIFLAPHQTIGHTIQGLFMQVIPLCVLLGLLFHYVVKKPLAMHLPSLFQLDKRAFNLLNRWDMTTFRAWLIYLLSVVIGFYTHILVDAFTHERGYFVYHLDVLSHQTDLLHLPVYKLLQYSFSLLGMFVIFITIMIRLFKSQPRSSVMPVIPAHQKWVFWSVVCLWAVLLPVLKLYVSSYPLISVAAVAPISGVCVGLVVSSIIYKR
ncbi:DUF4184 family protein [Paenibacillus sp. YAF4_2]|uniref:DUF4184 family protein n=1 Tax=Paenibacillus sp. YAF4_2 TaxID=3233085 RepID=UPI003F9797D7